MLSKFITSLHFECLMATVIPKFLLLQKDEPFADFGWMVLFIKHTTDD